MNYPLGSYLQRILSSRELSEREAARLCGISHSYLNQLINGINPKTGQPISPTQKMMQKIAHGLALDIHFLIRLTNGFNGEKGTTELQAIDTELLEGLSQLTLNQQKSLIPIVKELLNTHQNKDYIPMRRSFLGTRHSNSRYFIDD